MHKNAQLPSVFLLAVVAASVVAGSRMTAQTPGPRLVAANHAAVRDTGDTIRVYTDEQAEEGVVVFKASCAECHEPDEFKNADFRTNWEGRPLFELFEVIRTTMPDGDPGSLTREQYSATVAYMLRLNGWTAGDVRLATDSASLAAIPLKFSTPAP